MIVVGELLNASRKSISEAIIHKDTAFIQQVAQDQESAGAHYIDVNTGRFKEKEADYLTWLMDTVQEAVSIPCCIDSQNPKTIEAALGAHRGTAMPMVNAISLEKDRFNALIPLLRGTGLKVIAFCTSDEGMPETTQERLDIADKLVNGLVAAVIPLENIFVDPLVQPVSANAEFGIEFLSAVEAIATQFRGIHTLCGLSNISFGLANRRYLNQIFAVMAVAKGLNGLIANPLDKKMMANLRAAEKLAGRVPCSEHPQKPYNDIPFTDDF